MTRQSADSNGINGGSQEPERAPVAPPEPVRVPEPEPVRVPEPEPVRVPEPEPEPAVIRSTQNEAGAGSLNLHLSVAEMKERLRAQKKQDPRFHKTSFEAKSKMFERM